MKKNQNADTNLAVENVIRSKTAITISFNVGVKIQ